MAVCLAFCIYVIIRNRQRNYLAMLWRFGAIFISHATFVKFVVTGRQLTTSFSELDPQNKGK